MAEMVRYIHAEVPNRKYRLTAEHETNSAANAEYDENGSNVFRMRVA